MSHILAGGTSIRIFLFQSAVQQDVQVRFKKRPLLTLDPGQCKENGINNDLKDVHNSGDPVHPRIPVIRSEILNQNRHRSRKVTHGNASGQEEQNSIAPGSLFLPLNLRLSLSSNITLEVHCRRYGGFFTGPSSSTNTFLHKNCGECRQNREDRKREENQSDEEAVDRQSRAVNYAADGSDRFSIENRIEQPKRPVNGENVEPESSA